MQPKQSHDGWGPDGRRPLPTPAEARREVPLPTRHAATVGGGRRAVSAILHGADDRLVVVVGPCSIHDPVATLEFAERLAARARDLSDRLCVVMRAYVEKPRTTLAWKGLVSDPRLDGSGAVHEGILVARRVLLDIVGLGLPVASEFVDPALSSFLDDAVSWGAVGARTSQSQVHRQLASGLPMPVGFKNSVEGDLQAAVDAVVAASVPQTFIGTADDGTVAAFTTAGNPDGHVVLRGSSRGPNVDPASVADACQRLEGAGLPARVVVDASHGNSGKDHRRQAAVAAHLAERLAQGEQGIAGLMLESFLVPGRQDLTTGRTTPLTYGQSVTDACMGWGATRATLEVLAGAVATRRRTRSGNTLLSATDVPAAVR